LRAEPKGIGHWWIGGRETETGLARNWPATAGAGADAGDDRAALTTGADAEAAGGVRAEATVCGVPATGSADRARADAELLAPPHAVANETVPATAATAMHEAFTCAPASSNALGSGWRPHD